MKQTLDADQTAEPHDPAPSSRSTLLHTWCSAGRGWTRPVTVHTLI